MTPHYAIKRALLSVSNKTGIVEFAQTLSNLGVDIISTGGTSQVLREANVPHRQVEELTGLPEMLAGRVKTLHPKVHGGILGRRDQHAAEAKQHGIEWIDLVVVNFYPFAEMTQGKQLTDAQAIEYVDVGGPTMVRAAAKNFAWVTVVVDPEDYASVTETLANGGPDLAMRKRLATKVFQLTARYDAMIYDYLADKEKTAEGEFTLALEKITALRYGENPHQAAAAYRFRQIPAILNHAQLTGILSAKQFQGKPLSYNNIIDAEAALSCVQEFEEAACVIVKHANPCGAASADNINQAYALAYAADPLSAFGGIIALNRECTAEIADKVAGIFMEVIIAPSFTVDALGLLSAKPNLRVLTLAMSQKPAWELRFVGDGVLLQEKDGKPLDVSQLQIMTTTQPTVTDMASMLFAWRIVKHIKSNAILIAKDKQTVGIGAGQVSRVDAVAIAIRKAGDHLDGCVLASDAFFPFRDSIDLIAKAGGIRAIIQPGGSVRDAEVIAACNEHGISMVFTGQRCFRH